MRDIELTNPIILWPTLFLIVWFTIFFISMHREMDAKKETIKVNECE